MSTLKICSLHACLHNAIHRASPTNFLIMLLISACITVLLPKEYSCHLSLWDTLLHPNIISESIGQFQSNLTGEAGVRDPML